MSSYEKMIECGKAMGLERETLLSFVEKKEAERFAREERAVEREMHKLELENDVKAREIELESKVKMFQMEVEREKLDKLGSTHFSLGSGGSQIKAKCPKLPAFNDRQDGMDAYLKRFERFAENASWDRCDWATNLSALVQGKALDVYSRLSPSDALDYDVLKEALLKRFQLTEDGFRQKFRSSRQEVGETVPQFIVRLTDYLARWMELAKAPESFDGLRDVILREQFMQTSSRNLQVFLKERKISTVTEMAELAEQYQEAHGTNEAFGPNTCAMGHFDVSNKSYQMKSYSPEAKPRERYCYHCKSNSHFIRDCPNREHVGRGSPLNATCMSDQSGERTRGRGTWGNSRGSYRGRGNFARGSSSKGLDSGHSDENTEVKTVVSCGIYENLGDFDECCVSNSKVTLQCGHEFPVMTAACKGTSNEVKIDNLPVHRGFVNSIEVKVLRDTGCSGVVVRRDLAEVDSFTGKSRGCILLDGTVRQFPIAVIHIYTPFYTGDVETLCVENPVFDLILGNVPNVRDPGNPDKTWSSSVRSQQGEVAREQIANECNLKQHKVSSAVSDINAGEIIVCPEREEVSKDSEEGVIDRVRISVIEEGGSEPTADVELGQYLKGMVELASDLPRVHAQGPTVNAKLNVNHKHDKEQHEKILQLVSKTPDLLTDLTGSTNMTEHGIKVTTTDEPVRTKPYPVPHANVRKEDIVSRLEIGIGYMMGDPDYIIDCCGIVDGWEAEIDVQGTQTIYFQIWRPTGTPDEYTLVGENSFTTSTDDEHTVNVVQSERITILPNDRWGWYTSGRDCITYDDSGWFEEDSNKLLAMADPTPGDNVNWAAATNEDDRSYGIKVKVDANTRPFITNLPDSTTILNTDSGGTPLFTLVFTDVDTYDSIMSVIMVANTLFSFDETSTYVLTTTSAVSGVSSSVERLVFKVSDQCGNTATGTYTVTINNTPPTIHNLPASANLSEDPSGETWLHTINVTDSVDTPTCDLATSTPAAYPFFVRQVDGTDDYAIYCSSSPGLDYVAQNTYTVTVECDDVDTTVSSTFTIYLVQNIAPYFTNLQGSTSVPTTAGIGDIIYTVSATDPEGDQLAYTLSCVQSGVCPFAIFASGVIQLTISLTGHTTVGYDLLITVSDPRHSVGPGILTVTITDINDPVTINNLPLGAPLSVHENSAVNWLVYTVSYSDVDALQTRSFTMTSVPGLGLMYFGIGTSSGEIRTSTSNVLNYERPGAVSFALSVTVSDGITSDTESLTIDVTDVNEAPSFSQLSYSISASEGAANAVVGIPNFGVTDPDAGDAVTLSANCGADTGYFAMDGATGVVTFQSDYDLDRDSRSAVVTCVVTATDTGELTDTATLYINIANVNDNNPIFVPAAYSFISTCYLGTGDTVGTVTASDADAGAYGSLTLSLDQTSLSGEYFSLTNTGVIVVQASLGDLGCGQSVVVTAVATDTGGLSASAVVTIVITDTMMSTTTTTTDTYLTFLDDPANIACMVLCIVAALALVVVLGWAAYTCSCSNCPKLLYVKTQTATGD